MYGHHNLHINIMCTLISRKYIKCFTSDGPIVATSIDVSLSSSSNCEHALFVESSADPVETQPAADDVRIAKPSHVSAKVRLGERRKTNESGKLIGFTFTDICRYDTHAA